MAHDGTRLAARAEEQGLTLSFEASVAGGIPVIKTLREGLAGNRLQRVYGILNGTSNYILTTMRESGREFAEVLAEAQKLGYAEADPSFDIDGIDAAHKLAILASVGFGRPVDLAGVYAEGIRHVSRLDIDFAEELGYPHQAARHRPADRGRARTACPPLHGAARHPDRRGRRRLQCGRRRGRLCRPRRARRPRCRRVADRFGGGRRPRRYRRRPPGFSVRHSSRRAAGDSRRADRAPPERLLHPADGGRPSGRHRRRRRGLARRRGVARIR